MSSPRVANPNEDFGRRNKRFGVTTAYRKGALFKGVSTLFGRLVIETHSESLVPPSKRRFLATFLQKTSDDKPILAIVLQRKRQTSISPLCFVL